MKHIYCIIILLIFFYSCQSKSKKEYGLSQIENIVTENLQTIVVEVEDFDFEKLGIRKKYYNGENDAIIMSKKIKLI